MRHGLTLQALTSKVGRYDWGQGIVTTRRLEPVHRHYEHRGNDATYNHDNQHILQPLRHIHPRNQRLWYGNRRETVRLAPC
jgi:hypothetical protein